MKFGVHKVTWGKYYDPNDVITFLHQVKETGADSVELAPNDDIINFNSAKIKEIRDCAEDLGIELYSTVGMPAGMDMRSPDPHVRKYATEHMLKVVRGVAALGVKELGGAGLYSTWPTKYDFDMITPAEKYERTQRSIECVRQVALEAQKYNLEVNVEILNRFENFVMNTVDEGMDFIKQVDCPNCGLLLDVFHLGIEEPDLVAAIHKAKGHIGQFHVTEPSRAIPFHNTRINWPEIAKALKDVGYDRNITIEAVVAFDSPATYNMRMWRNLVEDVSLEGRIEAMKKGLAFLREQFAIGQNM